MPLQEQTIILPCATVAEVVPYEAPTKLDQGPEWLLGFIRWRGLVIPLISLELINQTYTQISISKKAHIAVLNRTLEQGKFDFYGILLQGMPKMGHFRSQDIELISTCLEPQLKIEVSARGEIGLIPNLQWIEERVSTLPNLQPDIAKS